MLGAINTPISASTNHHVLGKAPFPGASYEVRIELGFNVARVEVAGGDRVVADKGVFEVSRGLVEQYHVFVGTLEGGR